MTNIEKTYPTVHQLRKNGYKVKMHHERVVRSLELSGELSIKERLVPLCEAKEMCKRHPWATMKARGGKTTMFLKTPEGKEYKGVAKCCDFDNFCYKDAHQECLAHIEEESGVEIKV